MFSVCMFVCLSVRMQDNSKRSTGTCISMKLGMVIGYVPRQKWLTLGQPSPSKAVVGGYALY